MSTYGTGPARTLAALDEHQPRTTAEVAQQTGLTVGHTCSILRGLRREGSVRVAEKRRVQVVTSQGLRWSQEHTWLRAPGAVPKAPLPGHRGDLTLEHVRAALAPGGSTAAELATALNASPHQIGQALRSLRAAGRVECTGHRTAIQHGRTVRLPLWVALTERPERDTAPRRVPTMRNKCIVYEAEFRVGRRVFLLVVEDVLCSIRVLDPEDNCWLALGHGVLRQDRPHLTASGWYADDPDIEAITQAAAAAMPHLRRSRDLNEHEAQTELPHQRSTLTDVLRQDLEILRKHGPAQVGHLSAKSGRTEGALWCSLNALRAMGLAERQGTPGCAIFAAVNKEAA